MTIRKTRAPFRATKLRAPRARSLLPVGDLDRVDKAILRLLQRDAGITNVALASKVHLSPPACLRRTERLKSLGYVRRIVALLNPVTLDADPLLYLPGVRQIRTFMVLKEVLSTTVLPIYERNIRNAPSRSGHQSHPDLINPNRGRCRSICVLGDSTSRRPLTASGGHRIQELLAGALWGCQGCIRSC